MLYSKYTLYTHNYYTYTCHTVGHYNTYTVVPQLSKPRLTEPSIMNSLEATMAFHYKYHYNFQDGRSLVYLLAALTSCY